MSPSGTAPFAGTVVTASDVHALSVCLQVTPVSAGHLSCRLCREAIRKNLPSNICVFLNVIRRHYWAHPTSGVCCYLQEWHVTFVTSTHSFFERVSRIFVSWSLSLDMYLLEWTLLMTSCNCCRCVPTSRLSWQDPESIQYRRHHQDILCRSYIVPALGPELMSIVIKQGSFNRTGSSCVMERIDELKYWSTTGLH